MGKILGNWIQNLEASALHEMRAAQVATIEWSFHCQTTGLDLGSPAEAHLVSPLRLVGSQVYPVDTACGCCSPGCVQRLVASCFFWAALLSQSNNQVDPTLPERLFAAKAALMVSRRGGAKGKKKADTSDQPQESHQDENQDAVVQQAESQGENPQGSEVSSDQLVGGLCRRVLAGLAQEDVWG